MLDCLDFERMRSVCPSSAILIYSTNLADRIVRRALQSCMSKTWLKRRMTLSTPSNRLVIKSLHPLSSSTEVIPPALSTTKPPSFPDGRCMYISINISVLSQLSRTTKRTADMSRAPPVHRIAQALASRSSRVSRSPSSLPSGIRQIFR